MSGIDASPTKDFFISIITRDISLLDSVKDLVDNCVDGARKIRPNGDYSGLFAHVEISANHFLIIDNCGGISVDTARNYAFRFGRAQGAPKVDGSIGQFGVGMKRALFKMGRKFEVNSKAPDSQFELAVDVDQWKSLKDKEGKDLWQFEFKSSQEEMSNPIDDCGTTLMVTDLHAAISQEFGSAAFKSVLIRGLQEAHAGPLNAGLDIKVNSHELQHRVAMLLASREITPIKMVQDFPANPAEGISSMVRLTLYAGVSESSMEDAGWYIICNGRLIVKADKTSLTGWASAVDDVSVPKAHNQFARFRGYAIFESDDASALPWNTPKSGIDTDSKVYQWALREMVPALRQVIDFLNALDAEINTERTTLRDAIDGATEKTLPSLAHSRSFIYPRTSSIREAPKTLKVLFEKPREEVEFAKSFFNVSSASAAGREAFEYFILRERS